MKITQFSDFVKIRSKPLDTEHTGILNVCTINHGVELLNFQEYIGFIAGKNGKGIIMDPKVDIF